MAKKEKSEQRQRKLDRGQTTASDKKNGTTPAPKPAPVQAKEKAQAHTASKPKPSPSPSPAPSRAPSPSPSPAPSQGRPAPTTQEKQQRAADQQVSFQEQNVKDVADWDFGKMGQQQVDSKELLYLKEQGFDTKQIEDAARASGLRINERSQLRFDNWAEARDKAQQTIQNPVKQPVSQTPNANVQQEPNTYPAPKPPATANDIVNRPIEVSPPAPSPTPIITKPNVNPGPGTSPSPGSNVNDVDQSQDQTVTQDNDVNINGDGNTVNQDNSVRQYGGTVKSFIYNGSNGNNYMDTPVSAGTMGGYFYDADSPAKSASFIDRYTTMNDDYQKKYDNVNIANNAIAKAKSTQTIDVNALDQRIADRAKLSRSRSTSMAGDIFGDMFNYTPKEWEAPSFSGDDV